MTTAPIPSLLSMGMTFSKQNPRDVAHAFWLLLILMGMLGLLSPHKWGSKPWLRVAEQSNYLIRCVSQECFRVSVASKDALLWNHFGLWFSNISSWGNCENPASFSVSWWVSWLHWDQCEIQPEICHSF